MTLVVGNVVARNGRWIITSSQTLSLVESIELDYPLIDAIDVAKLAFEYTEGVKTYAQEGNRIVGKTGAGLASYGEEVTVDCRELNNDGDRTLMTVSGSKEVATNVTANPDEYVRRFVSAVHDLNGRPMTEIVDLADRQLAANGTKEVTDSDQQASGTWLLYAAFAVIVLFMLFALASI